MICPFRSRPQWQKQEDKKLKNLANKYTAKNLSVKWVVIADSLPGRTGKQCRERFHNHLVPKLKKGKWSEEEMQIILRWQAKLGNAWARIAEHVPGRSDNDVMNKYHSFMRTKQKRKAMRIAAERQRDVIKKKKAGVHTVGMASLGSNRVPGSTARRSPAGVSAHRVPHIAVHKPAMDDKSCSSSCQSSSDESEDVVQDHPTASFEQRKKFSRVPLPYDWCLAQEHRIELFRRGRIDCGITLEEVNQLKMLGLGLGVHTLKSRWRSDSIRPMADLASLGLTMSRQPIETVEENTSPPVVVNEPTRAMRTAPSLAERERTPEPAWGLRQRELNEAMTGAGGVAVVNMDATVITTP